MAAVATFVSFAMASSASATFSLVVCTIFDFAAPRFWGGRGGTLLCRRRQGMGQHLPTLCQVTRMSSPSSHQPSSIYGRGLPMHRVTLAGCSAHWRSSLPTLPRALCKTDRTRCSMTT